LHDLNVPQGLQRGTLRHIAGNRIEIMFGRLKDWRRVATRYDRCPKVFLSAIALAATVIHWLGVLTLAYANWCFPQLFSIHTPKSTYPSSSPATVAVKRLVSSL
jgi:hypothetical protein